MKKYLIIFGLLLILSIYLSMDSPFTRQIISGKRVNCLVVGADDIIDGRHSDAIILLSYNPKTRFLDMVSIPRDSKISIPGLKLKKINQLYAYQYKLTKSDTESVIFLKSYVEQLLGIRIPFYFQLDFDGFRNVIDAIGGINIKNEPSYAPGQGINYDVAYSSGEFVLNGAQALDYVRYRIGDRADLDRILRQQEFLCELLNRVNTEQIITGLPGIVKALRKNIHTNLLPWDLLTAMYEVKGFSISNIRLQSLQGRPSRNVWILDPVAVQNAMSLVIEGSIQETAKIKTYSDVIVEIFNASGISGAAEKLRREFMKMNYDVMKVGDYSRNSKYKKTVVIDRLGQPEKAKAVAAAVGSKIVLTKIDETRGVDVTVIIGQDWEELKNKWEK
jgi:LCP family protein required for cell wall assembly